MKRTVTQLLVSVSLLVVALSIVVVGVRTKFKKQAQRQREAGYEATLLSYSHVFKLGMTRKEVEDYLQTKNITILQTCCVDSTEVSKRHALDDLTKIGQEAPPWFCSENDVYIAFQFTDQGQHGPYWDANDLDTLKAITIYHRLEGCL